MSDDIPPQMKILNTVIPILIHFCGLVSNLSVARPKNAHHLAKCDVINNVNSFQPQDILSQIFDIIQ